MIYYYSYKQSFSGERPLAHRPSCFYILNRVPERHIEFACFTHFIIMFTLSIQIMKENTQKLSRNILQISFVVLRDLLNFGIQLFFKKQQHSKFEEILTYYF